MIEYIYRNPKTGREIKRTVSKPMTFGGRFVLDIPRGYKLKYVVDYRVSAKERKAK